MDSWLQDLRFALRNLGRNPGFAAAAAAILALGIGANSTLLSVVDQVLLAPLPFHQPERLVRIGHRLAENGGPGAAADASFSPQDFADLEASSPGLASLGAWFYQPGQSGVNLTGGGEPLRLEAAMVSAGFFSTLGVRAELGRALVPAENVPGADRVAVVSHRLWQQRLGGDPRRIGGVVTLDGEPVTVVGVMPPSFAFPAPGVDVWMPISRIGEDDIPHLRGLRWMNAVGRLAPGATLAGVDAAATALFARLEREYPDTNRGWGRAAVLPLQESVVGDVRRPLLLLAGAVGLVLLIACANLASLLLARAAMRGREMAIRASLGAHRGRLVRQLLTESLVLAGLGGALGLLLTAWAIEALRRFAVADLPRLGELAVDGRVAGGTFGLALLTGLLFGLLPALQTSAQPAATLQEGGRSGGEGLRGGRLRRWLVVAETALSVILLVGAGLLLQSFWRLLRVEPGFRPDPVLSLSLTMSESRYGDPAKMAAYRGAVLDRLAALPGVTAVGASKTLPVHGGGEPYEFTLPGRPAERSTVTPKAGGIIVTPGYFSALGIPLIAGRAFTDRDGREAPVLMVNQALARQYWGSAAAAVGQRVLSGETAVEVIGVVADVHSQGLAAPAESALYLPMSLAPRSTLKIFVRTSGDPLALALAVPAAIHEIDPDQPVSAVMPLRRVLVSTLARPRFYAGLLGAFAATAVLLAAVGLYGVLAGSVRRRTREIGVRMALGASRGAVLRQVLTEGAGFSLLGIALGLAASLALTPLLRSLLFGVAAVDPWTLAGTALLVAAVSLGATYAPALRAARIEPWRALHAE